MEPLFNVLWLEFSCAQVGPWLGSFRSRLRQRHHATMRMQMIALAVLIVALLPAFSPGDETPGDETPGDEIRTCTAPIETEHLPRQVDLPPGANSAAQHALMVVATILPFDEAVRLQTPAAVFSANHGMSPSAGSLLHVANRPPPAA